MLNKSLQLAGTFIATTLALAVTAQNAKALNFTFSFDNDTGLFNGTVTGIITGLEDNTSSPAASVIITDFPAGLGTLQDGNDATSWNFQEYNFFTVANGEIIFSDFKAIDSSGIELNFFSVDDRSFLTDVSGVEGSGIFSSPSEAGEVGGASFALQSTPVPFGVIPDTGISILAGIWGISRLRKTLTARKSLNK